ncbi:MAG: hypothetical protein JO161_11045, partial [Planctomycetaceae bacterium]|nr:hypothetical protein [Planctomycetaceae bacterium]
ISTEHSPRTPSTGQSPSPAVESLWESLNQVLELARTQGMLVEGVVVKPGSGAHLRHEESAGNVGQNGSDDGSDLSGPSRLEELFNLALESDHDEDSKPEVSNGGAPTEPSSVQRLNLSKSKGGLDLVSLEAGPPLEAKPAPVTAGHSEAVVLQGRAGETSAAAKNAVSPLEVPKAKSSKIGQGGFFPVECPSCQALGQVPPNRMDQQLRCAECGTKFYLDLVTNETIIGEKVTTKVAEPVAEKKLGDSKGMAAIDAMTNLPQKTQRRFAAMTLATIGLVFSLYYFWPQVGNTPGERTVEILQALTHNAPRRVSAIAVPSSTGDVEAWFRKVRPKEWPEVMPDVPVDINVISRKQTRASTSIDFPPSVAMMPGSQENPSGSGKGSPARSEYGKKSVGPRGLSLLLAWRYENDQWLFDATASLKKTYPPR